MKSPVLLTIAHDTIVSQVAAYLYATGALPESLEILDIKFGIKNPEGLVPLEIKIKEQEVDIIYFHGPQL